MEPTVPGVKPVGVITTVTMLTSARPTTVIAPVESATPTVPAYFEVVLVPQELKLVAVEVDTISEMQVRAELAARTISEALARRV